MRVDDGSFSRMYDNYSLPGHAGSQGKEATSVEEKAKHRLVGKRVRPVRPAGHRKGRWEEGACVGLEDAFPLAQCAKLPPEKPAESPRGRRSVTWEGRERLKSVQGRIAPPPPPN